MYGLSGLVLMENAGRGCADVLCSLGCRGPVAIVCGKGNNAGDGFVVARHLAIRGVAVTTILLSAPSEVRGDAAANFNILTKSECVVVDLSNTSKLTLQDHLAGAEWIVDALLGTGASGNPRPPYDAAIRAMNAAAARKLAIDLPSGLDCDTGEPGEPTFRADHTCTFVAPKIGFANPAAQKFLGQVHVLDIGVPQRVIEEVLAECP
jgi:NAD(P)H-hydrate epimerase